MSSKKTSPVVFGKYTKYTVRLFMFSPLSSFLQLCKRKCNEQGYKNAQDEEDEFGFHNVKFQESNHRVWAKPNSG